MKKEHIVRRVLSVTLAAFIVTSSFGGCAKNVSEQKRNDETVSTNAGEAIADSISEPKENPEDKASSVTISTDWKDYAGDIDTIVYGLIMNEYSKAYDVFNAAIDLDDGTEIFGLGYTDYSCLLEEGNGKSYFPAGFISYIGEPEIPDNVSEEGLEVYNLDIGDDISDCGYVLAYDTDPYMEHCVIWGQYLQYGIADDGSITYLSTDYRRGDCDETLGALYSYDEGKYVYDPDVGNAVRVTGTSLYDLIDYDELEAEVNRIIEEQDTNFSESEVESTVYIAQEALNSYMLAHQEETFMGYRFSELLEISRTLDPMECLQFTDEGMIVVAMNSLPPEEKTELTKWLVGSCCATAVVASIALGIFVPGSQAISGAVSGAAVEVFMEVILQNQAVSDVNWAKVGIAAASGAILAWVCPALGSAASSGTVKSLSSVITEEKTRKLGKLAGYGVKTFSSALISGATGAAYTYLDGGNEEEMLTAFKTGAVLAAACIIITDAASSIIGMRMQVVEKSHPNNWLTTTVNKTGQFIKNHQHPITKNEKLQEILAPKSICQATEEALQEVDANREILATKIRQMPSDDNLDLVKVDPLGKELRKNEIKKNGGDCIIKLRNNCSPEMKQLFEKNGITEIRVRDGDPDFSKAAKYIFEPSEAMTSNRNDNYDVYYTDLANTWKNPEEAVPEEALQYLANKNISRENLVKSDITEMFSDLSWTPHEAADGKIYLVDMALHSKISHAGGVAQAAVLEKIEIGTKQFYELVSTTVTSVYGTMMAGVAAQ